MNNVRLFLVCFLLAAFPQAAQAQRYYSDDGRYVADVEQIEQKPSPWDKNVAALTFVFYIHAATDKTPIDKINPLPHDHLNGIVLNSVSIEADVIPVATTVKFAPQFSDCDSTVTIPDL